MEERLVKTPYEEVLQRERAYFQYLEYCSCVEPKPERAYMKFKQCKACGKLIRGSNGDQRR